MCQELFYSETYSSVVNLHVIFILWLWPTSQPFEEKSFNCFHSITCEVIDLKLQYDTQNNADY
jgi:hypothetical protein